MNLLCQTLSDRLAATGAFKRTDIAATMDPIQSVLQEVPAALVFLAGGTAPEPAKTNASRQRVLTRYGIHLLVRNDQELATCLNAIEQSLLGWVPGALFDGVELHSFELESMDNGCFWYILQWRVYEWISADPAVNTS